MFDQPVGLKNKEVARQVRRNVNAIHLRRITRSVKIGSWPVSRGTNDIPDPLFHPGQRVSDPHPFLARVSAALWLSAINEQSLAISSSVNLNSVCVRHVYPLHTKILFFSGRRAAYVE
jgi:hypothetical protein